MADIGIWRRIGGLAAGSPWFQRLVYTIFHSLYQKRTRRYIVQFVFVSIVNLSAGYVLSLHQLPDAVALSFLITWLVPGFLVVAGIVAVEIPIGVIGRYEDRAKSRDAAIARGLYYVLRDAASNAGRLKPAESAEYLFQILQNPNGPVHFLTPNAIYILADRFLERNRHPEDLEAGNILEELARSAPQLRGCLSSIETPIHWIMPDPDNEEVRTYLKIRARNLGVAERPVTQANLEAARWVRELKRQRERAERRTELHRTRCVPGHRLLLTEDVCLFQEFPQRSPAVTQPTCVIYATDHPTIFEAIRLAISVWVED